MSWVMEPESTQSSRFFIMRKSEGAKGISHFEARDITDCHKVILNTMGPQGQLDIMNNVV